MLLLLKLKQAFIFFTSIGAIVVPTSLMTVYLSDQSHVLSQAGAKISSHILSANVAEDAPLPFSEYEASQACEHKAKNELGSKLFRSTIDWHSTRHEPRRGLYVVVLHGALGNVRNYQEADIYCYISTKDHKVSYFNAYDSKQQSLMSNYSSFGFEGLQTALKK